MLPGLLDCGYADMFVMCVMSVSSMVVWSLSDVKYETKVCSMEFVVSWLCM